MSVPPATPLHSFHPAVSEWFLGSFPHPTECQVQAWEAIKSGSHALIAAPTGSGKTLAAFLAAIDELAREGEAFGLPDETRVLYISPLKALSNDIRKNLEAPLDGINRRLFSAGATQIAIRAEVRTGDTPASARVAMGKRPPHILVSTPESAYILLTSASGRRMLQSVRTVIVDEIHALVGSKRGSHLGLSLVRLERLTARRLTRIGLSATQNPIETVAQFLTGGAECRIIDSGHRRKLDLAIELPAAPLESVLSGDAARDSYDRIADLIQTHRTTLVFVNTRRMAERVARALSERIGDDQVTSHHGSLAREQRLAAEEKLKAGRLKALVATASLELGIDVGSVDLVCQLGTTGSIATFLQRVGRSGHWAGAVPKGRLFPGSRDELVECIALVDAVRRGELDRCEIPEKPLDVLAQQIVAMVACEDLDENTLYQTICRAYSYRRLSREEFDSVVRMLAMGFATQRGLRGAYLHRDGIHYRLRARKGARLTAVTCGGAIPDNAEYRVIVEPSDDFVGTVDEDFAIESMAGDIFQLGNASWKVLRLEAGSLRVEDAKHQPPTIPFWFGEAPGRTFELSSAVSRLRATIDAWLQTANIEDLAPVRDRLAREIGICGYAAEQAVNYLAAAKQALGTLPTLERIVFERFFDESGGMQFIIHAPYGSRVNRAWGLALRKRFCRSFNFELQAAATENALILSLGTAQSFSLEEVTRYLRTETVQDLLVQAVLAAPMFNVRWRWVAVCALALKRFQGGRKTAPYLLRMQAEDLVAAVFPDQLACQENIVGDREIPDHPLVKQALQDCLRGAMDIHRFLDVIDGITNGRIEVLCRDLTEPSPLAAEIVNSKVYSFLDGAPLEERRTRAVTSRRWLSPAEAADLGRLDPAAISRVLGEAWPEIGSPEDLHEALVTVGFLRPGEVASDVASMLPVLEAQDRAARIRFPDDSVAWVAAERLPQFLAIFPTLNVAPEQAAKAAGGPALHRAGLIRRLPPELFAREWLAEDALRELFRSRLQSIGPRTAGELAQSLALDLPLMERTLKVLESEGSVLRGRFRDAAVADEWCDRVLLARIHRYTLSRLRREIEPVSSADFMRFLFHWQHLHPATRLQGPQALAAVVAQLEGFEAPAVSWEADILPARIADYDPVWLDSLCLEGRIAWARLSGAGGGRAPVRLSPLTLVGRKHLGVWRRETGANATDRLSATASLVMNVLAERGALFFDELADATGLLKTILETALAELVAQGFAISDSFKGIRALLIPEHKKQRYPELACGIEAAGRWTLIKGAVSAGAEVREDSVSHIAGVLLKRYGVVFRELLGREALAPPWRELCQVFRRMEARGEIRGGRFIAGKFGEQFALPEAIDSLRRVRKQADDPDYRQVLSGADPLNLSGMVTAGPRIPALPGNRVLYRDGAVVAASVGKDIRLLVPEDGDLPLWAITNSLRRRAAPPRLRTYL